MNNLENKVKKCYESAPFPDNLRKAKNFNKELERTIYWIKINLIFLSRNITKTKFNSILCAGCGTGEEAISLAKIFPDSKILAIDISAPSLKIASDNARRTKVKNITFKKYSILKDLPLLNKKFNFIYCAGVIHHLENPKLGFNILSNLLSKKGQMVIMLYNSYGLFFYKCHLLILRLLAKNNFQKKLLWVKRLGLDRNKGKSEIFDSYINPQVTTFTIEKIKGWLKEKSLVLAAVVPPLNLKSLIKYALAGKKYFFRRKVIISFVLKNVSFIAKLLPEKRGIKPSFPFYKTFFFQLIYLALGKGECQYLIKKS